MLWILPQCWSSWCMRLITHLYFLLRLRISAVVTVLRPVCLHGVHRDIFTFYQDFEGMAPVSTCTENEGGVESWNSVSSYSTVLCQNTECYLMISIEHGSLETSVHVGFPSVYCLSTVFVSGLFICSSALTAVVWTHGMNTSTLCFLKFLGCYMLWPILAVTSGKGKPHPTTGHEGQRGSRFIALVFL
jgi:hypothetical protein